MTDPNADLADIRQKWLRFCSHDTGLPYPCICPTEDHRPVIAALVGEVETLRAEVARLEGERDYWKSRWEAACTRLDEEGAQTVSLLVDKRRLLAERDEAQALLRLAPHHQQQVVTLTAELVQARAEVVRLAAERDEARDFAGIWESNRDGWHRRALAAEAERDDLLDSLKSHYLVQIVCDHERKMDNPWCACSLVDLGWHPSVGEAVQAWVEHVRLAAVDQMAPSTPPSTPQSDGQVEVAVTDAVEAPGGAEARPGETFEHTIDTEEKP